MRAIAVCILLCMIVSRAFAHEVRPAYLELKQTSAESYDVLWKVPGRGDNLRLGLYVEFATDVVNVTAPRAAMIRNAFTERWTVKRSGGITDTTIRIAGLSATMTDVLVRIERLDGTTQVTRLTPSAPSLVVKAAPRAMEVARTYTTLGVEHILTGVDHLLFVLALLIITRGGSKLVKTVTAFTVAHSITLSTSTLGFVHIPQQPVEAVIALSIVFVAAEILRTLEGRESVATRAPWIVAFTFGLLHGFGFAGALSEIGLPQGNIPLALLFFNLGVEIGQLLFIGAVLIAVLVARLAVTMIAPMIRGPFMTRAASALAAYTIGGTATFWVFERIAAF